jgi:hypothetical protein
MNKFNGVGYQVFKGKNKIERGFFRRSRKANIKTNIPSRFRQSCAALGIRELIKMHRNGLRNWDLVITSNFNTRHDLP